MKSKQRPAVFFVVRKAINEKQEVIVMLEALSGACNKVNPKNDRDLKEVLEFCSSGVTPNRKIRCTDGQEREFLFDR